MERQKLRKRKKGHYRAVQCSVTYLSITSSSAYTLTLIGHQVEDLGTGRMMGMYMHGTYSGCVLSFKRALAGRDTGRARAVE